MIQMIFEELDNLLKEVIRLQIKPNFARNCKRNELSLRISLILILFLGEISISLETHCINFLLFKFLILQHIKAS